MLLLPPVNFILHYLVFSLVHKYFFYNLFFPSLSFHRLSIHRYISIFSMLPFFSSLYIYIFKLCLTSTLCALCIYRSEIKFFLTLVHIVRPNFFRSECMNLFVSVQYIPLILFPVLDSVPSSGKP